MYELESLNLPQFPVKVSERGGKTVIWDSLRLNWVSLTPEEWVRQHFVHFLTSEKGYPPALLANEVGIRLNGTSKRCDTVAYDAYLSPIAIVEYKAPHVEITPAVFDQVVRYNMALRVGHLVVSNGLRHFCCRIDYERQTYVFLPDIPSYGEL